MKKLKYLKKPSIPRLETSEKIRNNFFLLAFSKFFSIWMPAV
jgi:hypothetical protein